jgi:hypothetical protein
VHSENHIKEENIFRIYWILTMVYIHSENHIKEGNILRMAWFYGFLPSCGILNNYKTQRSGNWIYFVLQVSGGRHLICWVPYKELNSVTGPFRPEHGNRSNSQNTVFSSDSLCGLVVRVLGYRSGGPGSIPVTTRKKSSVSGTGSTQSREKNCGAT